MALCSDEKKILEYLRREQEENGQELIPTGVVCDRVDIPDKAEARRICNRLHDRGLVGPHINKAHCYITPAGMEQLAPWWRRRHLLIVGLATLLVAVIAAVFTILLYLRGCEDKISGNMSM